MKANYNKDRDLINLGLIGVGNWGQNIVKTSFEIPSLKLTCVASKNPDTKKLIKNDCKVFSDWRDLINYKQIDGVII